LIALVSNQNMMKDIFFGK